MRCPICECNDTLYVSFLYQYSRNHKVNKNGRISRKYTNRDEGYMDCAILCCENGCNINENIDWYIDINNNIIIKM